MVSKIEFLVLLIVVGLAAVLGAVTYAWISADGYSIGATGSAVALMGWTMMSAEILLLLGFQAVYGYVFSELAVIVAGFMTGIAVGSWLGSRTGQGSENGLLRLLAVQISAALFLIVTPPLISTLGKSSSAVLVHGGTVILAICAGLIGGYQFPIALKIFSRAPAATGTLYALDLLGASAGALIISAYLVPVFGFIRTAELTAVANLCPIVMIGILMRRAATNASTV